VLLTVLEKKGLSTRDEALEEIKVLKKAQQAHRDSLNN
jgi:hypothetical protein